MSDNLAQMELKLVPLSIESTQCQVPENLTLLQCFQYLKTYPIMMGGFLLECRLPDL